MYARLERGWGTWDHRSSMTWALLPEGFALRLGLVRLSTGAVLQYSDNTVVTTPVHAGPTTPYPDPYFALKVGLHSLDNAFAELSVTWRGDGGGGQRGGVDPNAINVSIAATVDGADRSQLTVVATVNNGHAVNASDYALLVCPLFMFGRTGGVEVEVKAGGGVITGTAAGLRKRSVTVLQGRPISAQALPPAARAQLTNYTDGHSDGVYMAIGLGGDGGGGGGGMTQQMTQHGGAIFSTDAGMVASAAIAKTETGRAAEAATLDKYGPEWGEVADAVQTSLMWSLMYDPKLSLLAPSYAGVSGLGGDPDTIQVDGGTTEVLTRNCQFFRHFGSHYTTRCTVPAPRGPCDTLYFVPCSLDADWCSATRYFCPIRVFRASLSGTSPLWRTCSASTRSSWHCPT